MRICPLAPAHLAGLVAFQVAAGLAFINPHYAIPPLALYVSACMVSPLFPRLGFFLPIISRGRKGNSGVSLTFDDGPDPLVTPKLLDLLDHHGIRATFFVIGEKAERHPEIINEIIRHGHEIGNHSFSHDPLLSLKKLSTLKTEIGRAQALLEQRFGISPRAFRPPVGIVNTRFWRVLLEHGMYCVNFSCRAVDFGNRRIKHLSERILRKVKPRDIVALHDVSPHGGSVSQLLNEFDALFCGLKERGIQTMPLSILIGKEVMRRPDRSGMSQAAAFYDDLAPSYDKEQFSSPVSMARRTEYALFEKRLPSLFHSSDRVLDIGAGTGIFSLPIAKRCHEVVAVDISGNMLGVLMKKAKSEGIPNIVPITGDVGLVPLDGKFSVACAFSSLEYVADLPALFQRIANILIPGGTLYFTVARRSFFRLFTQIGNAMRQGLWLKARSRKELEEMLTTAGFEILSVESALLKSWISGGMVLEVIAKRRP